MKRWYVVHTQANGESKAVHHLRHQDFNAYLPRYLKRRRHARRTDWIPAPLFPRYLFIEMDVERDQWRAVSSTFGVRSLVTNGDVPAALPEDVVEAIRDRENDTGLVPISREARYAKGDAVQITDGALIDRVGICACASDSERVELLLDLLGREVRVRIPLEAVSACH